MDKYKVEKVIVERFIVVDESGRRCSAYYERGNEAEVICNCYNKLNK